MGLRQLRLATGLILFSYLTTHLTNHALGLISLEAMEAGRLWFLALWRNPLGTLALYGSLLTHFALALVSLYRRRHLRMPAWEALQLGLGLSIPPLLVSHIVGTRIANAWFGAEDPYERVVLTLWHLAPHRGAWQAIVLLVAWIHGCLGLHFWLRLRPAYPRIAPVLLSTAVLLPALALLGFAQAGRTVSARATPEYVTALQRAVNAPDPAARARLDWTRELLLSGIGVSLGATLLARLVRQSRSRRRLYHISYPEGRWVAVETGTTVLEASRLAGIPHASVCGGRGRCSTCRVRVVAGARDLPAPSPEEVRVLERVGAPSSVRLACQLRPTRDLAVVPVLPPTASARDVQPEFSQRAGHESEITVLFADVRQFTRLAEQKLPYDVVFFLNRYFDAVGRAIERSGGVPNQFTGDGVMALFGVDASPAQGCRAALTAAAEMLGAVEALSRELADELRAPLRIGIGIHAGPAVVGHMGYGVARYLTAVGDTVHVASRLQDLTKTYNCELIVSQSVADGAGLDVRALPRHELTVRNRAEPVVIYVVVDARSMGISSLEGAGAAPSRPPHLRGV
ncbi:MAG TPA: adenylate/guanylate cyclase domain-containing protein [Methylomirabilota bacterium]|nr:adenylate/guanylate cyclase domain-containing protein [Methylomirabilota bacterium]